MKKIMSLLLCIIMVVSQPAMTVRAEAVPWPSDTGIQSESGIVVDMDSGTVLFGQGIHVELAPASITKLLTALVVIENADLDAVVTYSQDAVENVESGSGNKADIAPGDQMTVRDCLYFLLLISSNQAANALAEHVSGSREAFVEKMNEKVQELGCENSHFANPSGLNDEEQYTSAYDMSLIARAAYSNPTLLEIGSTMDYQLPPTANRPNGAKFSMEHAMMNPENERYYEGTVAGKTGYTSIAGQTLVTYAVRDGRRLLAVTMRSTARTHYSDTTALMDFGFSRFKNVNIAENETSYTAGEEPVEIGGQSYEPSDLSMDPQVVITIPNEASFTDAQREVVTELPEDHPAGAVALLSYTYNERKIGEVYLISAERAAGANTAGEDGDADENSATPGDAADEPDSHETAGTSGFSVRIPGKAMLIGFLLLLAAAVAGFLVYYVRKRQAEERKQIEERRRKRRERLAEIGYSQEEFDRLMEQRSRRGQPDEMRP